MSELGTLHNHLSPLGSLTNFPRTVVSVLLRERCKMSSRMRMP